MLRVVCLRMRPLPPLELMQPALSACCRYHGYGLSIQEMFVCIYGGLRGAVGLAMALFVYLDPLLVQM